VEEGKLTVRVELPGIDPRDITVNVVGDMLTIRASRHDEHETKQRDFLHREFRYGAVERLMTLPQGVKSSTPNRNLRVGKRAELAISDSRPARHIMPDVKCDAIQKRQPTSGRLQRR
jgi:Hsp20/alpha crystallin family protein